MSCKIVFGKDENGNVDTNVIKAVRAENGNRSKLFDKLNNSVNDAYSALVSYNATRTNEFKKWFGNSPVIDDNNEPDLIDDQFVNEDGEFRKSIVSAIDIDDDFSQPETKVEGTTQINLQPFVDRVGDDGYSEQQINIIKTYNKNTEGITGRTIEVDADQLRGDKKAIFEKKGIKASVYERVKDAKGREFVNYRVSDAQDKNFVKYLSKQEAEAREKSPKSNVSRRAGTFLHNINEKILDHLVHSKGYGVNSLIDFNLFYDTNFTKLENTKFYKSLLAEMKSEESMVTDEKGSRKVMLDNLIKSMMKVYYQAYTIQNKINNEANKKALASRKEGEKAKIINQKPVFLIEKQLLDDEKDEAGTMDMAVIFSDGTAALYDHKFVEMQMEKKPLNETGLTRDELYALREKQGLSTKISATNDWAYFVKDGYQMQKKEESYNMQIGRYAQMLTELYGVKGIRQARILPVSTMYTKPNKKYDVKLSKVSRIFTSEDNTGVLQIPLDIERTGDQRLDQFIADLIKRKNKIIAEQRSKKAYDDPKYKDRIKKLDDAIKALQRDQDVNYIVNSILSLSDQIESFIGNDISVDKTDQFEDTVNFLDEIRMYDSFIKSTKKLIDELKETDEESYKRFKTSLGRASVSLQERQVELQNYMVQLLEAKNNKEGYMSTAMFREFENQGDMGVIGRYLSHLREVNHPLVSMFSQLLDQINYNVVKERQSMQKEIDGYNEKLKEWGKTKGLKGLDIYSMILNKKKELIKQFKPDIFIMRDEMRENLEENIDWFKETYYRNKKDEKFFQKKFKKIQDYHKKAAKDEDDYNKRIHTWRNENDIMYNDGNNEAWLSNRAIMSIKNPEPWYTDKFKELLKKENKPLYDFYKFYKEKMIELQRDAGVEVKANFVPEIRKDTVDTMIQNGIAGLGSFKQQFKNIVNTFKYTDKDDGFQQMGDKEVPIFFHDSVGLDNKSIDLAKSLMIYNDFIHNYKGVKDIEHVALSLRELLQNTQSVVIEKGKKIREETGQPKLTGENNKQLIAAFDDWINYYIYGEKKKGNVMANKVVDTLTSASSRKNLAFNWLSALGGHINAEAQLKMLASKEKYFSKDTLSKARKVVYLDKKKMKDASGEVEGFSPKAMMASSFFEINQDDLTYEKANEVSLSKLRNKLAKDYAFVLQRYSDDIIDNTLLTTMMMDYGIHPTNKKVYPLKKLKELYPDKEFRSLWDSADISGENFIIKDEHNNDQPIDAKTFINFRRKAKQMATRVKGNMSAEDIAGYKTSAVGRIVMQYRGWIPATVRERVKGAQYNMTMEEFEVGRWIAAYHMVAKNGAKVGVNFMKQLVPFMESKFEYADTDAMRTAYQVFLSDNPANDPDNPDSDPSDHITYEQYLNTYISETKALAKEFQMYIGLSLGLLLFSLSMGDDEIKENPVIGNLVKLIERAKLEIGFYIPVPFVGGFEETKTLVTKSPAPSFGIIEDAVNTLSNTAQESWDVLTGTPWDKTTTPKLGEDSWTLSFKERKDNSPLFKYTVGWIPGGKQITETLGVFNTTKRNDTFWDKMFGDDNAIYK